MRDEDSSVREEALLIVVYKPLRINHATQPGGRIDIVISRHSN